MGALIINYNPFDYDIILPGHVLHNLECVKEGEIQDSLERGLTNRRTWLFAGGDDDDSRARQLRREAFTRMTIVGV